MWGLRGLAPLSALLPAAMLAAGCTSSGTTSSEPFATVSAEVVQVNDGRPPPPSAPADYVAPFLGSRILAAVPGRLLLLDDRGRVTATTRLSGRPGVVTGPDGTAYAYDAGRLTSPGGPEWRQPAPDVLMYGHAWTLSVPGPVLTVVDRPYGPLVLTGGPGRCSVTLLGEGRQAFTDDEGAERCLAGAVDTDGRLAVLLLRGARLGVATVDLGRLRVVLRADVAGVRGHVDRTRLVALTDGLVAYVATTAGAYLLDLRRPTPVAHPLPAGLGGSVSVAGPDAVYVYGAGRAVARVTVSSGAVRRNVLPAAYGATTVFTVP
jgi:hypothetical protein